MLKRGRNLYKQVDDSFPKIINSVFAVRYCGVASQPETNAIESPCNSISEPPQKDVVIPPRIERQPTDILRALASSVGVDFTAFEYKYPDDPFFYPTSFFNKKVLALSLESGRKSAKWIADNNPAFFKHHLSEPLVQAFIPKSVENTESELTEQTLINTIEKRDVLKAIEVFKTLQENDLEVSESTKQCLLELVCFYNCEKIPEEEVEEKWFSVTIYSKQEINSWKNKEFAEELFSKMDPNCPLANSALIQGMFKYNEIFKACTLFKEAQQVKKIKLLVNTYNAYLSKAYIVEGDNCVNFIKGMLKEMSQEKVAPNLGTLNAALESLYKSRRFRDKPNVALKILKEFDNLGIKPSLGSFGYLFAIIAGSGKAQASNYVSLMQSIMDSIENEDHEILHPSDLKFFFNSMEAFSDLQSDLVLQLNNMLWKNNNQKFMIRYNDQHLYFKKLYIYLFKTKSIDFAIQMLRKYSILSTFVDIKVLKVIFEVVNENLAFEFLPYFWEEMKKANLSKNRAALRTLLFSVPFFKDETSLKIFHEGAVNFLQLLKPGELLEEDGQTTSCLLMAFVNNDDEGRVTAVIKELGQDIDVLNLKPTDIETAFEYSLAKKNIDLIRSFLSAAVDSEHSKIDEMMAKALPLLNDYDKTLAMELLKERKRRKKLRNERNEERNEID